MYLGYSNGSSACIGMTAEGSCSLLYPIALEPHNENDQ